MSLRSLLQFSLEFGNHCSQQKPRLMDNLSSEITALPSSFDAVEVLVHLIRSINSHIQLQCNRSKVITAAPGMIIITNYLRVGLQVSQSQSIINDELTGLKRRWNTHHFQLLLFHTFSCINNDRGTTVRFDDRDTIKFAHLPSRSTANTIVLPLPTPSF